MGKGRVHSLRNPGTIASDIGHEYAKSVSRRFSTRFFDGKRLVCEHGGETQVLATKPGNPLLSEVEDAGVFDIGETFEYVDLSVGDTLRVALARYSG